MIEYPSADKIPSFLTAEYFGVIPPDHCHLCGRLISSEYFRVKGDMACPDCAVKAGYVPETDTSNLSPGDFPAALLYGVGTAIMATAVCACVSFFTGSSVAVLSVAVGFGIGQAVKVGADEKTSAKFLVLAGVLAYLAICIGSMPVRFTGEAAESMELFGAVTGHLIWPFVLFARSDTGAFDLLIVLAGVAFAVKQCMHEDDPPLIYGPFGQAAEGAAKA